MAKETPRKRILVIDDDEDLATALSRLLVGAGYDVCRAGDGDEGLRVAEKETPDLIILDLLMPVMDGFDAVDKLSKHPVLRAVPVIALTAFGRNVGEVYGAKGGEASSGIQDILEKPFEPNLLLNRIEGLLA